MKAICTIAHGPYRELLEISRPALADYADRHDYDLIVVEQRLAPERPAAWSKIPLLHDLTNRYDLVVWIDVDAIVVDPTRDIARELQPGKFLHAVEHRIKHGRVPNSGVLALRGGILARRFLTQVWNHSEYTDHRWWENAAVLHLLGYRVEPPVRPARPSRWRAGTTFLDRAWNSIPDDPSPDPVIVHFPGMPLDERIAQLRALA